MKLIIAIAHERDKHKLADSLLQNGLTFTRLGSTGGFLRQGNVTILVGVEDDDVARVLQILSEACGATERYVNVHGEVPPGSPIPGAFPPHPIKVESGGAVAFVVHVDSFHRM